MNEKVSEVIEANYKNGIGKTGKAWSMASIVTDTGKAVTVFNPVNVGDEVTLTYNEQYKNYSGQVKQNSHRVHPSEASNDLMQGLKKVYLLAEENNKLLKQLLTLDEPAPIVPDFLRAADEQPAPTPAPVKQPARDWMTLGKPKDTEPLPEFPGSEWIGE